MTRLSESTQGQDTNVAVHVAIMPCENDMNTNSQKSMNSRIEPVVQGPSDMALLEDVVYESGNDGTRKFTYLNPRSRHMAQWYNLLKS